MNECEYLCKNGNDLICYGFVNLVPIVQEKEIYCGTKNHDQCTLFLEQQNKNQVEREEIKRNKYRII